MRELQGTIAKVDYREWRAERKRRGGIPTDSGIVYSALIMAILTATERDFLEVYLHEATTSPFFKGPATKCLDALGIEYRDISFLAWAYEHDVPRTSFELGHAADIAPPLPWTSRETVLRRDNEIRRFWAKEREAVATPKAC